MNARTLLAALLLAIPATPAAGLARDSVAFADACDAGVAPEGSRCGTLRVPEDRAAPNGASVSLRFVVVPGGDRARTDPIFYIAGGPGENAVDALPFVLPTLRSVDSGRAIVFLEQRGTGPANRLDCPGGPDLIGALEDGAGLGRCLARLRERADLDHYSSLEAAADLESLRAALGHRRINLVAVSYGVRVALLYMRDHPRQVRTATLRAGYPLDYNIIVDGTLAADRALARLLDDCAADSACRAAFPHLGDQLRGLGAGLAERPAEVTVQRPDGTSGQVPVTRAIFHSLLLVMMMSADSRQHVPLLISTAAAAGFQQYSELVGEVHLIYAALPVGMYLSVLCPEDAPRSRDREMPAATRFGADGARLLAVCAAWPSRPAPAATFRPFTNDVPTLIVSGALDPVTPVETASRLAATLPRATHLILPATAHGPMFPDCARPAIARFLRSGSHRLPRAGCATLAPAPFALPASVASAPMEGPGAARPAGSFEGTWDLVWQTRRGPSQAGHMVIVQDGGRLNAELRGRGSVRAAGSAQGDSFTLRGSRLFVPYTIGGVLVGEALEGTLRVSGIERRFTARRRAPAPPAAAAPPR